MEPGLNAKTGQAGPGSRLFSHEQGRKLPVGCVVTLRPATLTTPRPPLRRCPSQSLSCVPDGIDPMSVKILVRSRQTHVRDLCSNN